MWDVIKKQLFIAMWLVIGVLAGHYGVNALQDYANAQVAAQEAPAQPAQPAQ
jgi:hypothetical protein